jgi:hypothetical protein
MINKISSVQRALYKQTDKMKEFRKLIDMGNDKYIPLYLEARSKVEFLSLKIKKMQKELQSGHVDTFYAIKA